MKELYPEQVDYHLCIVNVGHFRTGTTTLAEAARTLGLKAYREFPILTNDQQKLFLQNPAEAARVWFEEGGGIQEFISIASTYDIICDGWIAIFPFLSPSQLYDLKQKAMHVGIILKFVATTRDVESIVQSELHHWVIYGLESKMGLNASERKLLEHHLRKRAIEHQKRIEGICQNKITLDLLPLDNDIIQTWPKILSVESVISEKSWSGALGKVGKQNANPKLPTEGILLTLRLGIDKKKAEEKIDSVDTLLAQIEEDSLCRYLLVLALDIDEQNSIHGIELHKKLEHRAKKSDQFQSLHLITNPSKSEDEPFAICSSWNEMATVAWNEGADWVVLLGDDVQVECSYHYRAIYRSFLEISKQINVPFGFGCPWWNDRSFPGFPSFPCVGKTHFKIFNGLVPKHRRSAFINQDLDPYLQRLYMKFMAAPCIVNACLSNGMGGNISSGDARYERIPAIGWKDFVVNDIEHIRRYFPNEVKEAILVDVVVPSYRVRLDYLKSICSLKVPVYMQTTFIIIIDNPKALIEKASYISKGSEPLTLHASEIILEHFLSQSGNTIRVRCNQCNVGASASRNRGLDESVAEFVLNLDDDLVPNPDLLEQYGSKLLKLEDSVVGLIGLVRFPRSQQLPLRHAAVLMSYLTFMFEIAEQTFYPNPAWGVTANILFRRTSVRFDLAYAKTGGGEDVDFSLRVTNASNGGKLLKVPEAYVVHPFWPGSVWTLSSHFFNWAIGDSGLYRRFSNHLYWSFPNVPETTFLVCPFWVLSWLTHLEFLLMIVGFILIDFSVDVSFREEYKHRCQLLQDPGNHPKKNVDVKENKFQWSPLYYIAAHGLANLYVVVLEFGRLYGHLKRNDLRLGMFRRFDWHCGRLVHARSNFRKREAFKFGGFLLLFIAVVSYHRWSPPPHDPILSLLTNTTTTCNNHNN